VKKALLKKTDISALKSASITVQNMELKQLVPHPKNPRIHPKKGSAEYEALRKSLEKDYFDPIVWNKSNGMLVSGHFRTKVLTDEGYTHADVVVKEYDEQTHLARMLAANKGQGKDDIAALKNLLKGMDADALSFTGWIKEDLDDILSGKGLGLEDSPYTTKVVTPIYTPKDEKPKLDELVDREKADRLIEEIDAADIPKEIKQFLWWAAERHAVFNFRRIADYYAHSDKDVQKLFEKSALVIIDFEQAIENGFVNLTQTLGQLADKEKKSS
jgi:hypothetical protein